MPREVRRGGRILTHAQRIKAREIQRKKNKTGEKFGSRIEQSKHQQPDWMQNEIAMAGKARKMTEEDLAGGTIQLMVQNISEKINERIHDKFFKETKVIPEENLSPLSAATRKAAKPVYYNGKVKHWNHEGCHSCPHDYTEKHSHIANNNKPVVTLDINSDSTQIVTGSEDKSVQIYSFQYDSYTQKFEASYVIGFDRIKGGHKEPIGAVAFSRNNSYAASSGGSEIKIWNISKLELHGTLKGHSNKISCLTFTPDHRHLVSGATDWSIRIWSVLEKELVHDIKRAHNSGVMRMAWTPDNTKLLTGSYDNTLKMWDFEVRKDQDEPENEEEWTVSYDMLHTFKKHSGGVHGVCMSWDMNVIATGGADSKLILWDTNYKEMKRKLMSGIKSTLEAKHIWEKAHDGIIYDVTIPRNDESIVSAGQDGKVKIWARISKELLHIYDVGCPGGVLLVRLSHEDRCMITSGVAPLSKEGFNEVWIWPSNPDLTKKSEIDFDQLEGRKVAYTVWFLLDQKNRELVKGPLKTFDIEMLRQNRVLNKKCLIRKGRRGENIFSSSIWVERESLGHAPFDVKDKETRWYYIDYGVYCLQNDPYNTQQMRMWAESKRLKGYEGEWQLYEDTGGVGYFIAEQRGIPFDKEAQQREIDAIEAKRLGKRNFEKKKRNLRNYKNFGENINVRYNKFIFK